MNHADETFTNEPLCLFVCVLNKNVKPSLRSQWEKKRMNIDSMIFQKNKKMIFHSWSCLSCGSERYMGQCVCVCLCVSYLTCPTHILLKDTSRCQIPLLSICF